MKKSLAPLHTGSAKRELRTLVVFESMHEVLEYVMNFNGGILPSMKWGATDYGGGPAAENFWLKLCIDAIKTGDPALNREIAEQAERWKDMLIELEPRFAMKYQWASTESSGVFDAGAIASNEDKPCFDRIKPTDALQPGRGGGAYRIIINTDIPWWCSVVDGAAAMGAVCLILQEIAPVEVWVQQGWMGHNQTGGVTLFPVMTGGPLNPMNLAFWSGHEYKDIPFSWIVNRLLGRKCTWVSIVPELDCNIYFAGFRWPTPEPYYDKDAKIPEEIKLNYIKDILHKTMFVESLSGWQVDGDYNGQISMLEV